LPLIFLVWVVLGWLQIVAADAGGAGEFFNGLLNHHATTAHSFLRFSILQDYYSSSMNFLRLQSTDRFEQFFLLIACCIFLLVAFSINFQLTAGLNWPYDVDHMRDIGAAQSILDGNWPADPFYLGEGAWYPPLMPAVLAALSAATGMELPTLAARTPAFINLLSPITFTFMTWRLLGARVASVSLAAFLFMIYSAGQSSWFQLYSPWGFPIFSMLPFLFLGVVLVDFVTNSKRTIVWLYSGAFVGFSYLAHTAIALLLLTLFASSLVGALMFSRQLLRDAFIKLLLFAIGFLIFASPFLASTFFRYFHGPLNLAPQNWLDPVTTNSSISTPFFIAIVFAVPGAMFLWKGRRLCGGTLLIFKLTGWSVFFFAWAQTSCTAFSNGERSLLPSLMPSFHFLLFICSSIAILFSVGLIGIVESLVPKSFPEALKKSGLGAVVLLLIIFSLYTNKPWEASNWQRQGSLALMSDDREKLYHWILENSDPNTVYSANTFELAELMVMPAGRKLVAMTNPYFSNPFVSWDARSELNTKLWRSLINGESDKIAMNLSQAGAEYLLDTIDNAPLVEAQQTGLISLVNEIGRFRIYRVL
jgi:hypothetical protein